MKNIVFGNFGNFGRNETKYVIHKGKTISFGYLKKYISPPPAPIYHRIISPFVLSPIFCSLLLIISSTVIVNIYIFIRARNTTTIRYMLVLVGFQFFFAIIGVRVALAAVFVQTAVSV